MAVLARSRSSMQERLYLPASIIIGKAGPYPSPRPVQKVLLQKFVYFCVSISKCHCMVGISRHSADSKENQRFQGADVFLGVPEKLHIVVVVMSAGGSAAATVWAKPGFFWWMRSVISAMALSSKLTLVRVANRPSTISFHVVSASGVFSSAAWGESDESSGKFILKSGCISGFPQTPLAPVQPVHPAVCSTLKTKHVLFHK